MNVASHSHHYDDHEPEVVFEELSPHDSPDTVRLSSLGLDIGTATMQMVVSMIEMERRRDRHSSDYVVTACHPTWVSGISLTPYQHDGSIDAGAVRCFVDSSFEASGLVPDDIDTGAVLLTGEAARAVNAGGIRRELAESSGNLVCAAIGDELEAVLAAHGSGAVDISRREGSRVLSLDVGGGTTKLTWVEHGEVQSVVVLDVGSRHVIWGNDRRAVRIALPPPVADGLGVVLGDRVVATQEASVAQWAVSRILSVLHDELEPVEPELVLARSGPHADLQGVRQVVCSGGSAEYLFQRELREFGDLGRALAGQLRESERLGELPTLVDGAQAHMATVFGLSQSTLELSGCTVFERGIRFPLRGIPVVHLSSALMSEPPENIAAAMRRGAAERGSDAAAGVVFAFEWTGPPAFARVDNFARGIVLGVATLSPGIPFVIALDADLGLTLGRLLLESSPGLGAFLCVDGVSFGPLDFVDIGGPIAPAGVHPVVVKSLLLRKAQDPLPREPQYVNPPPSAART